GRLDGGGRAHSVTLQRGTGAMPIERGGGPIGVPTVSCGVGCCCCWHTGWRCHGRAMYLRHLMIAARHLKNDPDTRAIKPVAGQLLNALGVIGACPVL